MLVSLFCMLVLVADSAPTVAASLLTAPPPLARLKNTIVSSLWGQEAKGMPEDPMMAIEPCWYKDYRLWLTIESFGTAIAWYVIR